MTLFITKVRREHVVNVISLWSNKKIYPDNSLFRYESSAIVNDNKVETLFLFDSLKELMNEYNYNFKVTLCFDEIEKLLVLI